MERTTDRKQHRRGPHDDHQSSPRWNRRILGRLCLAAVLAVQFAASGSASSDAAEPALVAKLRQEHATLRKFASSVQGEIREFRSEVVIPEALDTPPTEIDISRKSSGKLWRSPDRFRADFRSYGGGSDGVTKFQHSIAADGDIIYMLFSGFVPSPGSPPMPPSPGSLRIYDRKVSDSAAVSIDYNYAQLDALWRYGKMSALDLLDYPGATLQPSTQVPGGYVLSVSGEEDNHLQIEFDATRYHPIRRIIGTHTLNGVTFRSEQRIDSEERNGVVLPVRIAEVASLGPDRGYSQVVLLDLEPLQPDSPIARPITADSFHDLGFEYRVYQGNEGIVEGNGTQPARWAPTAFRPSRNLVLSSVGVLIIGIVAYLFSRFLKTRRLLDHSRRS